MATTVLGWASVGAAGPTALAVDSVGNLFCANANDNTISRITPAGVVNAAWVTLGGQPFAITTDSSGNVHCLISGTSLVTISAAGVVTSTLDLSFGVIPGYPNGLVVDAAGNVYVTNANVVSKITPAGAVAASWPVGATPWEIGIDTAGNMYVVNRSSTDVSKVTPAGVVTTVLSNIGYSPALAVTPSGVVYVGTSGSAITQISSVGVVTPDWVTIADTVVQIGVDGAGNVYVGGSPDGTIGSVTQITPAGVMAPWADIDHVPTLMAVSSSGVVYTADQYNGTGAISRTVADPPGVVHLSGHPMAMTAVMPAGTTAGGVWAKVGNNPNGIAFDAAGNAYVTNTNDNTVSKITHDGVVTMWSNTGYGPQAVTVDAAGNVYTANSNDATISKITSAGVLVTNPLGGRVGWAVIGNSAAAIVVDAAGTVYTANRDNTISKVTPAGVSTTAWVTLARSSTLQRIVIDAAGNLYTCDESSRTVAKITPAGVVTPAWASTGSSMPVSIAIDPSGNIYTAGHDQSTYAGAVTVISPAGTVTAVWPIGGNIYPMAVGVSAAGNMYVAYYGSAGGSVAKISATGAVTLVWATIGNPQYALAVDSHANVYTTNSNSNSVSKIALDATGSGLTLAGPPMRATTVMTPGAVVYAKPTVVTGTAPFALAFAIRPGTAWAPVPLAVTGTAPFALTLGIRAGTAWAPVPLAVTGATPFALSTAMVLGTIPAPIGMTGTAMTVNAVMELGSIGRPITLTGTPFGLAAVMEHGSLGGIVVTGTTFALLLGFIPGVAVAPLGASGRRLRTGTATYRRVVTIHASGTRVRFGVAGLASFAVQSQRWRLDDLLTGDSYKFAINPNADGSPTLKRQTATAPTTASDGLGLVWEGEATSATVVATGVLHDLGQYDAFVAWWHKRRPVLLTDDLGRRSLIYLTTFTPKRAPLRHHPQRMTYTLGWQVLENR